MAVTGAATQHIPGPAAEQYVLQQASCRASHLVTTAGFPTDDWEDLRQDMALDCLQRAPQFDSDRGEWPAFVRGVVRNRSAVLIMRRGKRVRFENAVIVEADHDRTGAHTLRPRSFDPTDSLHLRMEIDRVLATLPPDLRRLAAQLGEMSVPEIAKQWGKSKSWIYILLRRLREAFREAGITPTALVRSGGTA